jgi:hypothetical protein
LADVNFEPDSQYWQINIGHCWLNIEALHIYLPIFVNIGKTFLSPILLRKTLGQYIRMNDHLEVKLAKQHKYWFYLVPILDMLGI